MWTFIVLMWVVWAAIGAAIAPQRGYTVGVGFFACLIFGLFGVLYIALVKGNLETPNELRDRQLREQWQAYYEWQQQNTANNPLN